jgi:hypothetical protein
MPGRVWPAGGLSVRVFHGNYYINSSYISIADQDIDLTSYIPGSTGALYVIVCAKSDGTITVKSGSAVASRGVLAYTDIPTPDAGTYPLAAVVLENTTTQLRQGLTATDFVDLRFSGYAANTGDATTLNGHAGSYYLARANHTGTQAWSTITATPTTLAGYGITDPIVLTTGSYANPAWITSLAWSKITGTPTTLAGYGITDAVLKSGDTMTGALTITPASGNNALTVNGMIVETGSGTIASAAGAIWNGIAIGAGTATITGSTNITTATGFNFINIAQPILSAASALTIASAATFYIANAPSAGGAGPATLTNAYAIWVDNGITRLDGRVEITGASDVVQLFITPNATQTSSTVTVKSQTAGKNVNIDQHANFTVNAEDEAVNQIAVQFLKTYTHAAAALGAGAVRTTMTYVAPVSAGATQIDGTMSRMVVDSTNAVTNASSYFVAHRGQAIPTGAGTGGIFRMIGLSGDVNNLTSGLTITQAIAVEANIAAASGATITTAYGLVVATTTSLGFAAINAAATLTTLYGIYVEDLTVAATTYAIWTNKGAVSLLGSITAASAAGMVWKGIEFRAATLTVTGSTHVTTAAGANYIDIARPTLSAASALTVDQASTLYIANSPAAGGAGPLTITNAYAIWVDAGPLRLDGNLDLSGAAGGNIITDTTTGTIIGTATNQKLALWNAAPIVQPANTVAIDTLLVNIGLRASGGVALFDTDAKIGVVGKGLYVKEGTNATMGVVTLVLGTATVNTTKVTANSRIFLAVESLGTITTPVAVSVTGRVNSTSFTITSANLTDTSVISWIIIEPA